VFQELMQTCDARRFASEYVSEINSQTNFLDVTNVSWQLKQIGAFKISLTLHIFYCII